MKRLGIITFTVLAWAGSVQGAGSFIVDPSASVEFAPSITTSTNNNIPLINIVAPTAAGISHNKYQKFDVGTEGVIHNNSLTGAQTSILDQGTLSANPNFSSRSATTIIDEVTSANASSLEGAIEVYGDSASVIIANPNGISCNGCSFINAPNSTLTTGAVSYGDTGKISIDTSGNDSSVTIGSSGLDGFGSVGARNENISLIAREIILGGKVFGTDRVDIISGSGEYDFSTGSKSGSSPSASFVDKAGTGTAPTYQIDASSVSEVNAGKINIVATENGVGVHLGGQLHATASDIVISTDGDLSVLSGGQLYAVRDVSLTSDTGIEITNKGSILAARNLTITGGENVTNDGGAIRASRKIDIDAEGRVRNYSAGQIVASVVNIESQLEVDQIDLASVGSSIIGTYQSGVFTATNAIKSREEVAIGLANAIEKIGGLSTSVSGNEIIVSVDADMADEFSFNVETVEKDGSESDSQSISISGSGTTRYVKILGSAEADDVFTFRAFGDVTVTAPEIRNYRNSNFYSYGNENLNYDTDCKGDCFFNTANVAARLTYKGNGSVVSGWSNQSKDWASMVPTSSVPRFTFIGSYEEGAASSGKYYQPSVSVSTASLSTEYLNTELAEKVVDKDAIIFASDPFIAAQTAATSALVTTASSFVVEDREKEMASIALAEETVNAEQELALIETTGDVPIISVQRPVVGTIQLGDTEGSGGIVGRVTFASTADSVEISADGQLQVSSVVTDQDEQPESPGEAGDDDNDAAAN